MTQSFTLVLDIPDDTDPQTVVQELTSDLQDFNIISLSPSLDDNPSSGAAPAISGAFPTPTA